ncbi:ATP-binding cassette domain-containing protein [Methylobacterium sp. E-016]|uniref:ABC transporter ATP-binding protein n=1 Tax=Methylobacterium sp. E-016 TaxID=2836556 RepID=UPI002443A3D5|nr:ATP-binding cassette domain-containing protein [Methylobacterium sp. E-016]
MHAVIPPALRRPDAPAAEDLATAIGLSHCFGTGDTRTQILTDITISIPPGQLVIMTGPSGSGKTTLLTLLGALRSGQSGVLTVLGRHVTGLGDAGLIELRRSIGFIFQLHNLLDSLTAIENVMMAAQIQAGPTPEAQARAAYLLERVGLGQRMRNKPSALSGGQRQRVAVARALVNAPRLVLADEPTAALDAASSHEVVSLLQEHIAGTGASCLMVTHDNRVLDKADRIVSLVDGRIVSDVMVREQVIVCEMLAKIEFFGALSPGELSQVAEKMERRRYRTGDVLIRQGEIGEHFYLIRTGAVDIHVAGPEGDAIVATLGPGRYFGERALITGEVRNATIVGGDEGYVHVLDKTTFEVALASAPTLQQQIRNTYFSRQ